MNPRADVGDSSDSSDGEPNFGPDCPIALQAKLKQLKKQFPCAAVDQYDDHILCKRVSLPLHDVGGRTLTMAEAYFRIKASLGFISLSRTAALHALQLGKLLGQERPSDEATSTGALMRRLYASSGPDSSTTVHFQALLLRIRCPEPVMIAGRLASESYSSSKRQIRPKWANEIVDRVFRGYSKKLQVLLRCFACALPKLLEIHFARAFVLKPVLFVLLAPPCSVLSTLFR